MVVISIQTNSWDYEVLHEETLPGKKNKIAEKVIKNNLRIISKPHAYLQTMSKTPVKFQKNQYKTVGGDAHTRYPLSIHFDSKNVRKMAKFNWRKKC